MACSRGTGISKVVALRNVRGAVIHLIRAESHSAVYPLTYSWSTITMNFFSGYGFCSLYPGYTSQRKALRNMLALRFCSKEINTIPEAASEQHKYELRGFTFLDAEPCPPNRGYDGQCPKHIQYPTGGSSSYVKWCEGSSQVNPFSHTLAACPQDTRSLFDNHSFYFTFIHEPYKGSLHDKVFTAFTQKPDPNPGWKLEWRLGQYNSLGRPNTAWCAGYTATTLSSSDVAYPTDRLYKRVVLHISDFLPYYNGELEYLRTLPSSTHIDQKIQGWVGSAGGDERDLEMVLLWPTDEETEALGGEEDEEQGEQEE